MAMNNINTTDTTNNTNNNSNIINSNTTPLWEMTAPWAVVLTGNSLQASPNEGNPGGQIGDLDLCENGNLPGPTVRIWTENGWKEIPLATRFMSGEWHPDMEALSPAGDRAAAFFAHGAAFPCAGNNPLPGGPAEALARLMSGDWG